MWCISWLTHQSSTIDKFLSGWVHSFQDIWNAYSK